MFNTIYHFDKVTSTAPPFENPHILRKTIYRFDSNTNNRYLVEIHEHPYHVYGVKFYHRNHKKLPSKYKMLTNLHEWGGVLRTVVQICLHVLSEDNHASFAFVGVPKQAVEDKGTVNSQRFRVYSMIVLAFMGTETFTHVDSPDANSYLLVNQINANNVDAIIEMMKSCYQNLSDLLGT